MLALLASRAVASELSERLYSRGLVELHAERWNEALALFDQAAEADPNDAYALYYRGVTRGRLDDREGAIADFRAALELRPDLTPALGELGYLLGSTGRYEEALPLLERAAAADPANSRLALAHGVTLLRLRRLDEARARFERAGRDPALVDVARYYQGVTAYQTENWEVAEGHFAAVATATPETEVGREAQRYLDRLRAGAMKPYRLYADMGFQYDSNVCLIPDDDGQGCASFGADGDEDDGRAVFTLGGLYSPWHSEQGYVALGYEFFQSLHFNLTEFNLQDHRPSLQAAFNAGPVRLGMYSRYDYYLRETDSFLQEGNVIPWLMVPEEGLGRTEVFYRMRLRDFRDDDFDNRDGFNHSTGLAQYFYLGSDERWVSVGYRFDAENPDSNALQSKRFSYDGNEVNTSLRWLWPFDVSTFFGYAFRYEYYDGFSADPRLNADNDFRRRDKEHRVTVVTEVPINRYLGIDQLVAVALGYFGTFNDSNKNDEFEYTRHIASFTLRAAY
jgi:tetratricopeptide (TPR) repeat protein